MNIVIVPSHNQEQHIQKIVTAYENQTVKPDLLLFVFDRCSDNSRQTFLKIKSKLNIRCLFKLIGNNFSAGMTRDFGLDYVENNYPNYTNIIFTDGDCVPSPKLVEIHVDCLKNSFLPAVSCGRRIMIQQDGSIEEDERIENTWTNDYSFTNKNSRLLISNRVTLDSIFTYSCNLAFNKSAVQLCKKINLQLSNSNRLFNPEFDGSWGGEDNFISDCLFRTGNNILLTSLDCFVEHQWHPESDKTDISIKKQIVQSLSYRLKQKIISESLPGDFTIFEKNRNIFLPTKFSIQEISNIKTTKKEENFSVIDLIKYPVELTDDIILFSKYILSRNRVVINATTNNNVKRFDENLYNMIIDFITFSKVYLIDGQLIYESEEYNYKSINNMSKTDTITHLLNNVRGS